MASTTPIASVTTMLTSAKLSVITPHDVRSTDRPGQRTPGAAQPISPMARSVSVHRIDDTNPTRSPSRMVVKVVTAKRKIWLIGRNQTIRATPST